MEKRKARTGGGKFIKNNVKVKVQVKKAIAITTKEDRTIVIAEINSWEQKRDIMGNKKGLETRIRIEDDLTRKEREIQQRLWKIAGDEREKGIKRVKVGYMKIKIEEKCYRWNEKEERLEEERRRA